jgi:ubiquinone/menaquinone biosynthesis C-methylase UbiE
MPGFPTRILSVFLRVFFLLLYEPFAWAYDWVAAVVSLGQWRQWVLSAVDHLPGPIVLELGHGPGHLQLALLYKEGVRAVGLDSSRQMTRIAFGRLVRHGFQPKLVSGYAQSLPFSDESFHQVVATFPSDYIWEPETLAEIHRVLTPEGDLLLLPAAWITGEQTLHKAAAWLFRVTRQSPAQEQTALRKFRGRIGQAGFQVDSSVQTLPSSQLLFIRGKKKPPPP